MPNIIKVGGGAAAPIKVTFTTDATASSRVPFNSAYFSKAKRFVILSAGGSFYLGSTGGSALISVEYDASVSSIPVARYVTGSAKYELIDNVPAEVDYNMTVGVDTTHSYISGNQCSVRNGTSLLSGNGRNFIGWFWL